MIRMLARVGILFHFVDDSDLRHIELTIFLLGVNNFLYKYYWRHYVILSIVSI